MTISDQGMNKNKEKKEYLNHCQQKDSPRIMKITHLGFNWQDGQLATLTLNGGIICPAYTSQVTMHNRLTPEYPFGGTQLTAFGNSFI